MALCGSKNTNKRIQDTQNFDHSGIYLRTKLRSLIVCVAGVFALLLNPHSTLSDGVMLFFEHMQRQKILVHMALFGANIYKLIG